MNKKLLPLCISSLALANHPNVLAQNSTEVEEVIVTARKRSENLQDVPIAITAFTEKTIQEAGIERAEDFILLTPNVTMVDTSNVGDTQVTIRGQVSTRDAEGTFAYVVDGVLITNPNGFNEELFDLQQLEVLKGPQGALYGRNAVAGAIIVTTKDPEDTFTANATLGAGSNSLARGVFSLSGPVSDNLGYRLAISHREDDGQFENPILGGAGTVDYFEDTSIRGRLLWEPSELYRLDFQVAASDVSSGAINFNAVVALNDFEGTPFYADVNDHEFDYFFNVPGENEQENFSVSLKSDYDFAWAKFTVILAHDDLQEYLLSDGTSASFNIYAGTDNCASNDGAPADFDYPAPFFVLRDGDPVNDFLPPYSPTTCDGYQYQERNQDSTSLEMKFSGTTSSMSWVSGLYFADISREVVVAYGADLGQGFLRQAFVDANGPNPTDSLFSDDFATEVASAFTQLEYALGETQELGLALRYDRERRQVNNNVDREPSPNNAFTDFINPFYDLNPGQTRIADRDKTFTQLQPKISWRMALSEDASIYTSYGLGFRSGGFNALGSEALIQSQYADFTNREGVLTAPQNLRDDYDKEVTKSAEVGFKSEWLNNRLRANAALFDTVVENNQFFNFFASGQGIQRIVTNIDEISIQGIELDFRYLVSDQMEVYGSYGFINSEIIENRNRSYTEGNEVPMAPKNTANLGLSHGLNLTDTLVLRTRLDWQYIGETWFSTVQNDETENSFTDFGFGYSDFNLTQRDPYDTLNLRLSLGGDEWSVTAWGRNILDEQYLEEVIPAPEFGGSFVHQARGAMYGVDVSFVF
ncbi:MAG: TonB-dependent receptor [Cellvibrionaceae bacterium]|nr:TonB-dependent receptor [Cellvibrionaceae bacterium]